MAKTPRLPPADGTKDDDENLSSEVRSALEIADEILELTEDPPESIDEDGEEFFVSVAAKASDIADTLRRTNRVSARQLLALENMLFGVKRWRREDDC